MSKIKTAFQKFQHFKTIARKKFSNRNFLTLLYKLLHDALFILLFSFTLILIAEGLLPGLASSHLSPARIAIVLVATLLGIATLGKKLDLTYPKIRLNQSRLLPVLIVVSFLLIGNSLLRFQLWQNILITLLTLFFFILFYHLLFSEKD